MPASSEFLHQLFGLDDQVAVVIGGTGVLGGALAEGLAQAGARVVVAGRSEERGHERVKAIEEFGGEATFLPVTADQRHKVVDGSLLTTHLGCQIFAPFMASQSHGGSILNIGSVTSHLPLSRVF